MAQCRLLMLSGRQADGDGMASSNLGLKNCCFVNNRPDILLVNETGHLAKLTTDTPLAGRRKSRVLEVLPNGLCISQVMVLLDETVEKVFQPHNQSYNQLQSEQILERQPLTRKENIGRLIFPAT
jgi:hypothetical protein